jgi:hypothetical protein
VRGLTSAARTLSRLSRENCDIVIPAKAGIQRLCYERHWIPAFAGMTRVFFASDASLCADDAGRCADDAYFCADDASVSASVTHRGISRQRTKKGRLAPPFVPLPYAS